MNRLLARLICKIHDIGRNIYILAMTDQICNSLKSVGSNCSFESPCDIMSPERISIGNNFSARRNFKLRAFTEFNGVCYEPEIIIGDDVLIETDVHIGSINRIVIGNNVVIASRVYIGDHYHGKISPEELALPPMRRELFSPGTIVIDDNVWIGEGVSIMPGVSIGKNVIVGSNAVVTRDVPPNSVVAGVPAKVIKVLS